MKILSVIDLFIFCSIFMPAAVHAAENVILSDTFESGMVGANLDGQPLNNGLGGTVSATWLDPGKYATYRLRGSNHVADVKRGPWDEYNFLTTYEIDPTKTYALEFLQKRPEGVLDPDPWNPHGGAVILSTKTQHMARSGVVVRLQGPELSGWDPNRYSVYYFDGTDFFQPTSIRSGPLEPGDFNAQGAIPVRLVFTGAGTSASPLKAVLYLNGRSKGSFSIKHMAQPGRHVGFVTQAGQKPVNCAHGWTDQFKLSEVLNPFPLNPEEIMLLTSTLGYDSRATKRALLGFQSMVHPATLSVRDSAWQLLDAQQRPVLDGRLNALNDTFGYHVWEIDFSQAREPGQYTLRVDLQDTSGRLVTTLASAPFTIEPRLHFKETFAGIAIRNPEARAATEQQGGGYYDCNTTMGEAYSHGAFLAGLAMGYQKLQKDLTPQERDRLHAAANRAADYLILLHNKATGEITCQYPTRMEGAVSGAGFHNTYEGIWGLTTYAAVFKELEPARARDAYERSLTSYQYLKNNQVLYQEHACAFMARFHAYEANQANKTGLLTALKDFLDHFDIRTRQRGCGRCIPYFEGLHYCVTTLTDHPDRTQWIARAKEFDQLWFQDLLRRNAFHVIPQGGAAEWDDMAPVPPEMYPPYNFYASTQFGTMATDAILLAEITGDRSLEKIATAGLGWITGLSPGVPGDMTVPPGSGEAPVAASFLVHLQGPRYVSVWKYWKWEQPAFHYLSIVNGLCIRNGQWFYSDGDWPTGETFIKHDGTYIHAIAVYDDYLERLGPSSSTRMDTLKAYP